MTLDSAPPRPVRNALAPGQLGVAATVFFVLSGAAPLTVVAGIVPTGYAATGVTGLPLAFLLVGIVLLLFAQGYLAMAEHITQAGAFYAYITRGLGRPTGVAAAWVALLSYNSLQVGLYGAVGAAAVPLLDQWWGIRPAWWIIALTCWALVAVLGVTRLEVNGRVLAVLLCAEIAVITLFSLTDLLHPAEHGITLTTLAPSNLFTAGGTALGAVLAIGVLGFVGFESGAVLREELRDPRRTLRRATITAVMLVAALYAFAAWAMSAATGPDQIVTFARQHGAETVFTLAGDHLGTWAITVGHALFVTSILAAMISLHHIVARYVFVLGRDHVLAAALGRTWARTQAPWAGSVVQTGIALTVIIIWATGGWDPALTLFYWLGTSGGLGVLLLLLTTSLAVLVFFARHPLREALWRRRIAPILATVGLAAITWLAFRNLPGMLGVTPGHPMTWAVPTAFATVTVAGLAYSVCLRATRPAVYVRLGRGDRNTHDLPPNGRDISLQSLAASGEETSR